MRVQLFSDLHLEHARGFVPEAAPDATLLVLPGDVGHSPETLRRFAGWPVPILFVPGNHEYDERDYDETRLDLADLCDELGMTMLDRATVIISDPQNATRTVRFIGATRWCDFDLLGPKRRDECAASAQRYLKHMGTSRYGRPFDSAAVRDVAIHERQWLEAELREPFDGTTVVVTHFAPSPQSADPRYGLVPGTASFCNDDRDLLPLADWWLHGHLHCAHDYAVDNARRTRVVCNPRGFEHLGEHRGFRPLLVLDL